MDQREPDFERFFELVVRHSANLNLSTLREDILLTITALLGASRGMLLQLDPERRALLPVTAVGLPDDFQERCGRISLADTAAGASIRDRQIVQVADVETDSAYASQRHLAWHARYRSVCCVPLIHRKAEVVGAAEVYFEHECAPSPSALRLVELYAFQAGQLITNGTTYDEVCQWAARLEQAEERARLLEGLCRSPSLDSSTCLQILVNLGTIWFADCCVIDLIEPLGQRVRTKASRRDTFPAEVLEAVLNEPSQGCRGRCVSRVMKTGRSLDLREIDWSVVGLPDPADDRSSSPGPMSALLLPLGGSRPIGVMMLVWTKPSGRRDGYRELMIAESFASRAGAILERLELRERIEEEARIRRRPLPPRVVDAGADHFR